VTASSSTKDGSIGNLLIIDPAIEVGGFFVENSK
jgi:hypothetical protein